MGEEDDNLEYIRISNLNKKIKNNTILKDINLSVKKGYIYGIIGRNGSGKTMLFRAISGLIKPTSGEIFIDSKKLHKDISFPESIGIIIEQPGFWEDYTGFENLRILASIKNIITEKEIKDTIKRVGLDPNDTRDYKKYSLGMKQRLAVAQAIMEKPDLIILDEPTNGLDDEGVSLVREILIGERDRGATILIASHNREDIDILADKKYRMDLGSITKIS